MSQKLFIIHGWTYSLDKWQKIVPILESNGFDVELLKVPGLTSPSDKVWDIDGYVDWLDQKLKDAKNVVLVGHSNGGRISMAYLNKYPDKVTKLILIDSAGVYHDDAQFKLKLQTLKLISKIAKLFIRNETLKKMFYKVIGSQDYFNAPPNMKATMQNMLKADKTINPSIIKVPTTIIWGRNDQLTPLTDGQKLHQAIAGSSLRVIDDARHAPFFTNPDQVVDYIKEAVKQS
jgi:pimeloyl-ACP methyl ester carboxylesterase